MTRAKEKRSDDYTVLAGMLREERKRHKLTLQQVGTRLGLTPGTISKREYSELRVDLVEFVRYAQAVGFDPQEFFAEFLRRIYARKSSTE